VAVTKTLGPLHFEDLDPHRFEDLVRELIYDFKDWQSIEGTGRGGADDGFDIRAYERTTDSNREPEESESEDGGEPAHPMEGNLWMFQCKRESEIGPSKVAHIIDDGVKAGNPPYGYVLAAPTNFSKKSFDVFRGELRQRGVMEFYMWGRAALEDMLHLPKNDRVLFTFFGISLVTRRRSRATDVRAIVTRKNKLMRIFNGEPNHESILVRDLKDEYYPDSSRYTDFAIKPRWQVHTAIDLDPRGLVLQIHEHFAYWDQAKKEWDMAEALNLALRYEDGDHERRRSDHELRARIESFWHFIPHANRTTSIRNGLVRFEDMEVIDDKGDSEFKFPHIFVDFDKTNGPFAGYAEYLRINEHRHLPTRGLKRIERFPAKFEAPRIGKVHSAALKVADRAKYVFRAGSPHSNVLYDVEGRLDFLADADVIAIEGGEGKSGRVGEPLLIQITHKRMMVGRDFLESLMDDPSLQHRVEEQIGREVAEDDQLRIVEFKVTSQWAIEQAGADASPAGLDERIGKPPPR
jgi:hypothetical protein